MLVLVGLGNPGGKYANHRHNVGFLAADAIADAHGFGPARSKFQSEIREGTLSGLGGREKALIVKPQTFMNESGQAVREIVRFYKLSPEDVFVFYDELDLAAGKLRTKIGGGAAGHNGIRSIDAHIGNNFCRIRIGIGHPGDKSKVTNHVLGDFSRADQDWLSPLLAAMAHSAPFLAEGSDRFATDVTAHLNDGAQRERRKRKKPSSQSATAGESNAPADKLERTSSVDKPSRGALADALQKIFGGKD